VSRRRLQLRRSLLASRRFGYFFAAMITTISRATTDQLPAVLRLVGDLLRELSDDPAEFEGLDLQAVTPTLATAGSQFLAFLALDPDKNAVGVLTLTEAIAVYAGGRYGIISELYVAPALRGTKVGRELLEAAKAYGRSRGWRRLDVTAPPEARWQRTVAFYKRNGFVFTGPKLRCALPPPPVHHGAG
jgi:GNAT superfamily N-acetyltransferase